MRTLKEVKKRKKSLEKTISEFKDKQRIALQKDVFAWEQQIDMFRMALEQIDWVLNEKQ